MADDRDVLELDPDDIVEGGEKDTEPGNEPVNDEDEEELVIGFDGEEAAPASEGDNSVIREMRRKLREKEREIADLRKGSEPKRIEVGEEPSLEGCDYDEDRFKSEWSAWKAREKQAAEQETEAQERTKKEQAAWGERIRVFETGKTRLAVADFDDAEAEVSTALSNETMAIIMHSDKSAELVYALARNPAKLEELSKLNPLRAAMMVGKLEDRVTMSKRKLPDPDRPVNGNAAPASADKQLARLEKDAERTGDRTALIAYRRKLRDRA